MKKIVVIGEILVEIMADTQGRGFLAPQALTGPFPSGAPAIFASQAARMGQPVAIVSAVGDDDFGRVNLDRLTGDGVDVSGVYIDPDRPTGTAFVRYRADGARDFVFNIRHSACGTLHVTDAVSALIDSVDHVHIMGSSLSSAEFVDLNLQAGEEVRARGGTVSFDPNLRKEILTAPGMADAMARILALTDLYLPSGDELTLLTQFKDQAGAIDELLGGGIKAIVHKNGAQGATYHDADQTIAAQAFQVGEIDPTGAGDCFGGTFTTLWLRGAAPEEALRLAMASGALAVTRRGPMEGAADRATLDAFLRTQEPA
ncbi:MAG: sugar kinase [Rhodobacteraceae bacterium]|nr:sugar kinase [Paracoccaceae bacterium]MAY45155.1 sugar kinase [Paracoccaceae bacterium]